MLYNAPAPVLITVAYVLASGVLMIIDNTRSYATFMLYLLPIVIFWAAWSVISYGKSIAKKLKDDEFGYGG